MVWFSLLKLALRGFINYKWCSVSLSVFCFATCMFSLVNICSDLLLILKWIICFTEFLCVCFGYKSFIKYVFYNYFLPVCGVSFVEQNVLVLMMSTNFFLNGSCFGGISIKIHSQIQGHLDFCYFLSVLCFTFRSVIHFDVLWMM